MADYQETTTEISYTEYNANLTSLNKASYQKSNNQSSLPDGYNLFVKP
ncbi:3359_t:CDS:1, partial [Diversispora eburnea]